MNPRSSYQFYIVINYILLLGQTVMKQIKGFPNNMQ